MTPWQKAPPREPGVYWTRDSRGGHTLVELRYDDCSYAVLFGDEEGLDPCKFHEWWPTPIPPPEPCDE